MRILESGYQIRAARVEELPLLSHIELASCLFLNTPYPFLVDADPLSLELVQQRFQSGQVWVAVDLHEAVVGYAIALMNLSLRYDYVPDATKAL